MDCVQRSFVKVFESLHNPLLIQIYKNQEIIIDRSLISFNIMQQMFAQNYWCCTARDKKVHVSHATDLAAYNLSVRDEHRRQHSDQSEISASPDRASKSCHHKNDSNMSARPNSYVNYTSFNHYKSRKCNSTHFPF